MGAKTKQHIVGLVNKGHILGMEEAIFGASGVYNTGALCTSLKAELYYIDKEIFTKALST